MVKTIEVPKFANEEEEAKWWASREGRAFLKRKAATPKKSAKGSRLVTRLNRTPSVQIALRLPEPDVEKARELAQRKGIGYQTLLKMLVRRSAARGTPGLMTTVTRCNIHYCRVMAAFSAGG